MVHVKDQHVFLNRQFYQKESKQRPQGPSQMVRVFPGQIIDQPRHHARLLTNLISQSPVTAIPRLWAVQLFERVHYLPNQRLSVKFHGGE